MSEPIFQVPGLWRRFCECGAMTVVVEPGPRFDVL
jgi:hypothetical protein